MHLTLTTITAFILMTLASLKASATNYYVSSHGSNSTGRSDTAAWQTIAKVNASFSTLVAGDSLLFHRGETFTGTLTPTKGGSAGHPIVIGSYGTGAKPVIQSLTTITGWVSNGNGIWTSATNTSLPTDLNVLFLNGVPQDIGRYPNGNATNKGYITLATATSTTVNSTALPSSPSWIGADLVVRPRNWVMDRRTISNHSGGTVTVSSAFSYTPYDKMGFFFVNHMQCLDQFGEWSYNLTAKTTHMYNGTSVAVPAKSISMYFGTNTPSSYTIQASNADRAISIGYSYITVVGLNAFGANVDGIYVSSSKTNIRIIDCLVRGSGRNGINADAGSISNSIALRDTVMDSYDNGVRFQGTSDTVQACQIINTYSTAGMGGGGDGKGIGLNVKGSNHLVKNNRVYKVGYIGIDYRQGNNTMVVNNVVDSFCYTKDDGGGIYTFEAVGGSVATIRSNNRVTGNIVINGVGVKEGTNSSSSSAFGIYMDKQSNHTTIDHNVVANCTNSGIYFHNPQNIIVRDNLLFNNNYAFYINSDYSTFPVINNQVVNNVFFAKDSTKRIMYFLTKYADTTKYGKIDSNWYCRPIKEVANSNTSAGGISKITWEPTAHQTFYSLEKWKTALSVYDQHTKRTVKGVTSLNDIRFEYNPSPSTVTINLNAQTYIDPTGIPYTKGYVTLSPYTGVVLLRTINVPLDSSTNKPPIVAITVPTKDTTAVAGATLTLTATASDPDATGAITNVAFYDGSTLLGNDNVSPFTYTWPNVSAGTHNITARATDNSTSPNNTTTSIARVVTVTNAATNPTVALTSPANNAIYTYPDTVQITATATAYNGATITKVDFYKDTTLLHTETVAPYDWPWNLAPVGNYKMTAVATDSKGLQTTSAAVGISVRNQVNKYPVVTLTAPANNTPYVAPASITITATASDSDGTINNVSFYSGATLLFKDTTSPYSYSWTGVAAGTYNITAKATDNLGAVTTSLTSTVTVGTTIYPTVSITAPLNNALYTAPANITINASASTTASGKTIKKVNFYQNNILLNSDTVAPYSYPWNGVVYGKYSLTAIATDNTGLATTSGAISIQVDSTSPPLNKLPVVTLDTPLNNAIYTAPATVRLYATASDPDGTITNVKFYNGSNLILTENTAPYQNQWTNVAAGIYNITAVATDNQGGVTTSAPAKITVNTANSAPVVTITSPVNNATYIAPASIQLTATATDKDGTITKVEFYNGTTLIHTETAAPYDWPWTSVPVGIYHITAKAYDNLGATTTSASVSVSVGTVANKFPTVSLTSPPADTVFQAPVNIVINATASDTDGTISKVDFYQNSTLLGSDVTAPFSYTWNNTPAGSYNIYAIATDNSGATTRSVDRNFSVTPVNQAPKVAITAPINNATILNIDTVLIKVAASDTDGSVINVGIYNGTTLLASLDTVPYNFTWRGVAAGTYTLTAKATDDKGLVTTSAPVSVVFKSSTAPSVSISTPSTSLTAPATISATATATDADGSITKVEFYQNTTLVATDLTSPYSYSIANQPAGTYKLTAKAYDNSGLTTTSTPVTVTVTSTNSVPTVSMTGPANNSSYLDPAAITLTASASDIDGVVKSVTFYNGTTPIGTDTTAPYSVQWSSVMKGTYTITAKATDDKGGVGTSTAITILVNHINTVPTVTWISPLNGETTGNKGGFTLNVNATDADGSIASVKFYNGTSLMATLTTLPYTITTSNMNVGTYTFKATATDNSGASTSASVTVKVLSSKTITLTGATAQIVP